MKIEHPTHIGYAVDDLGFKRTGPCYLVRNKKSNWVRFRITPGEWDGTTGTTTQRDDWHAQLVDIRPIEKAELLRYWEHDWDEAQKARLDTMRDLKAAEQRVVDLLGVLATCDNWVRWNEDCRASARLKEEEASDAQQAE